MDYISDRITMQTGRSQDPRIGSEFDAPTWPTEPGRYRLHRGTRLSVG